MKKLFLPFLLLHFAMVVNAATYYFSSSSGDDSRSAGDAQNQATPWQSIDKVNSIMSGLKPGDQILFKRGETFVGGIDVKASGSSGQPITFGAYGSGNRPIITGFVPLSNWSQVRNNVWEADLSAPNGKENMVTMNNKQEAIGRYPNSDAGNSGYLNIDSHSEQQYLSSSQLNAGTNWVGGDIVIRKERWVLDRSKITYQAGTGLGFDIGSTYDINDNYGFFIENHPGTLDEDGEWYYDMNRNKLQMYFSSDNPNTSVVKGSTIETLVNISAQRYISFNNLTFSGANSYTFNLANSDNISINYCNFRFTGINAINALSCEQFTLGNSNINYTNNDALYFYWNCNNVSITGNKIKNTGTLAGMGLNGGANYQGIMIRGNSNLIQYNEIDSSGYNGIHFEGDYSTVQNNFINTFGFVIDDCGGIYTGQGTGDLTQYNSKNINNNIVINGIGALDGTDNKNYNATQGIYLDDNTNHVTVSGNTVANCGQAGIFNHNATYTNITNNTMYNNGKEQFLAVRSYNPVSNVTVTGNIMFAKTATQLASRMDSYSGYNNIPQFGNVDNNYYCRPIDNNAMFYYLYLQDGTYHTSYESLDGWKSKLNLDNNSQVSSTNIPAFTYDWLSGQNLFTNGSFDQNVYNVYSFSSTNDVSTTWNSNKLDGGTLQVSANNYSPFNNFNLTFLTNNYITAGKNYLLTYSLQGAANNSLIETYLRMQDAPYSDLTTRTKVVLKNFRQTTQVALTPTQSTRVAIEMDVQQPNGAIWLDNVTLQEANISYTNPDDYIVFAYNPNTNNKQVSLPDGNYYDATGKKYNNNVELKPYTSVVLIKESAQNSIQTSRDAIVQNISLQGNLTNTNIASASTASAASTDLNWTVNNQKKTATSYQIERSADAANFTSVSTMAVKASADSSAPVSYQFKDAQPLGGKNYYRVKQLTAKGETVYSKIVMVNNISFKLNPNPARDVVHIIFDQPVRAEDHLGKEMTIRNPAGSFNKTLPLAVTDNMRQVDVNVSSLQPGLYILSITSEGKLFSKTFLKQ